MFLPGEPEYLRGEFRPGGLAFAGHVEGADQLAAAENVPQLPGDGQRGGGIAVLIRHHLQFRPGPVRQLHHGVDEAGAAGPVEPGDPADHMIRAVTADGLFAGELALAVNGVSAVGDVEFAVRPVAASFENIIRTDGDEPDPVPVARRGHVGAAESVELIGEIDFRLAFVHRRHGGAVDDRIGGGLRQKGVETGRIGDVGLGQVRDHQLALPELLLKSPAQRKKEP